MRTPRPARPVRVLDERRARVFSRPQRYTRGMRPPEGAIGKYRRALAKMVARLHARTLSRLLPALGLRADALTEDQFKKVSAMLNGWKIAANDRDHSTLAQVIATDTGAANAREFERVFRVAIPGTQGGLSKQIDAFRERNVQLIKSIETEYLDRVAAVVKEFWDGQTRAGEPVGRMSDLDESNARQAQTLSERLQAEFGVTKRRGDLIARDQVLKLNAQLAAARQQTVGVTHYIWTTSHDERVRGNPGGKYPDSDSDHYRLDGRTFAWNDPPIVNTKTGERAHPGEDYQCRCVAVPVMVDPTEGISDEEISDIFAE